MSVVHTLIGARPPERADADPFTEVRIEESLTEDGIYTALVTQTLAPPEVDAAEPIRRNLTFESEVAQAWYRLVWLDASGDLTSPTDPVYDDGNLVVEDWSPTVGDVAALIRARTKLPGGAEAGTFNENTRPTAQEVEQLISVATRNVRSRVGQPCTDELSEDARGATAIRAAMLVESSYWPEQTRNAGSSFQSLLELWRDDIKALVEAIGEQCGGGNGESVGGVGRHGVGYFDDLPLIGRSNPEQW